MRPHPLLQRLVSCASTVLACCLCWLLPVLASSAEAYEVWVLDQSDTSQERGGVLFIYEGQALTTRPSEAKPTVRMDLAQEINSFCEAATKKPVRRPHMLFFNKAHSHAIISFLSGQVLFVEAASRRPVVCLNMGKNLHAAWPTPNEQLIIGANMAEKKLLRIWTDYSKRQYAFDPEKDALALGPLEGGERPDNAPVCPITESSSRYAFVTLKGGGLFVVDVTASPMKILASLNNIEVHPAGCGGYQVGETLYINSGGGWPPTPLAYDIYAIKTTTLPGSVSAKLISSRDDSFADSHGMVAVGRYLWSADRAGNTIEVIDSLPNLTVNTIQLVGSVSDDPAPDLMDISPDGAWVFVSLRGPTPLSGNVKEFNNAKGSTPGVGVIKVTNGGRGGELVGVARISNEREEKETTDPHGIAVRK